jgi:hypothetical protein
MKILIFAALACLPLMAADPARSKASANRSRTAAQPVAIPADAVETTPGTFAYTDPQGKKWLYRKTPFGVAKVEDKEAPAPAAAAPQPAKVKATEEGDTIHFERPGPFGVYKWNRKKAELSDDERRWLEQARQPSESKSRQE